MLINGRAINSSAINAGRKATGGIVIFDGTSLLAVSAMASMFRQMAMSGTSTIEIRDQSSFIKKINVTNTNQVAFGISGLSTFTPYIAKIGKGNSTISVILSLSGKIYSMTGSAILSISNGTPVFSVSRHIEGGVDVSIESSGGMILRRPISGEFITGIDARLAGYRHSYLVGSPCTIDTGSILTGRLSKIYTGVSIFSIEVTGNGSRIAYIDARAVIEALSFSTGVVNIFDDDLCSQRFYKSSLNRNYAKELIERSVSKPCLERTFISIALERVLSK